MTYTPDSAKEFLLMKLFEQASLDAVSISEIEKRMFLFSETSQNPPDFEASDKFDAEYDDEVYEAKIAQLLKRVYARDKQTSEGKALWKKYLDALANEDFYGLVMVDQAGISH
jgi:hypothetical protein